jgi:hypothetical protein
VYDTGLHIYIILLDRWISLCFFTSSLCLLVLVRAEFYRFYFTQQTLAKRLDSKDWVMTCEALNNVRQLAMYHKERLQELL